MSSIPDDRQLYALALQAAALACQHGWMLATAESCTGGWIAKVLTDVPGSSAWFSAGIVTYGNRAKQDLLNVDASLLETYGAVSQPTVLAMARGVLARVDADVVMAVTGIAGPAGGSVDKPAGTVWLAWQHRDGRPWAECFHFAGDREAVRRQTVMAALEGTQRAINSA